MNCFDSRFDGSQAEYLSSFNERDQIIVWGRTGSKADTIAAALAWIGRKSLIDLEIQFEFVDGQKRKLSKMAQAIVGCVPKIQEVTTQEFKRLSCDLCELWFIQQDRACKLSYYGKNKFADAIFHWDKCELFRLQAEDTAKLAAVLNHWLCDHAMPSKMRTEHPWIEIGELANYYENGKPIEGEFVMSWNSIEHFYTKLNFRPKEQILKLIAEMRQRGYDKTLRAGQSMFTLVLSRSRRIGLRQNQPCLRFSFKEDGIEICARSERDENYLIPHIMLSPQVESLLQSLVGTEID